MNNPLHQRRAGILLHPTSLPSGKIDNDAISWLDLMQEAGLSVWQVLPLGFPQLSLSPYLCNSAFAMNPALLDGHPELDSNCSAFLQWTKDQSYWLDDFVMYCILRQLNQNKAWFDWPDEHKNRDSATLESVKEAHENLYSEICWEQHQLDARWQYVKQQASKRDIAIFGDMPIFVAHDSADVWANRECFLLDNDGQPELVAGVPPDYFSETGQRWGNPHYNWEHIEATGFEWWVQRMRHHYRLYDIVRIDHFRGLQASWMIPASCPTAIDGYWQEVPGAKLLTQLIQSLGDVSMVAEDLGLITPEVIELRDQFNLPGMSVLQFSFDGFEDNPHKPENIHENRIVYTGTHDNDTTLGWYQSLDGNEQNFVYERLGVDRETPICTSIIDSAMETKACLAVVPLQDFLQLDTKSRMNTPGTIENNWDWRFDWQQIPDTLTVEIKQTVEKHKRIKE